MKGLAIAIVFASRAASSAPLTSLVQPGQPAEHLVTSEIGLDGAVLASVGFAAGVARAGERLDLAWWADLAWVAGHADLGDNRERVGARVRVARAGRFQLHSSLSLARRAAKNTGFSAQTLSSELVLEPSVTAGRFTGAVELGIEQGWLAHVAPTETYRDLVYAMAQPDWYAFPGRTVRAGGAVAVRLAAAELTLRAGYVRTGGLDFLPPFYLSLGVGARF